MVSNIGNSPPNNVKRIDKQPLLYNLSGRGEELHQGSVDS